MLAHFLALLCSRSEPNPPLPIIGAVSVSSAGGGACTLPENGTVAAPSLVAVDWTIANADPAEYETRVYEDGAFLTALPNTQTHLEASVWAIEGSPFDMWQSNSVYRVDVVWKQDGRVVASASSAPWVRSYGRCPNFPGEEPT